MSTACPLYPRKRTSKSLAKSGLSRWQLVLVRVKVPQLFASRTAIHILIAKIDKVLLAKATPCLNPRCHRLWKRHRNSGLVTYDDFLAAVVAAIGNGLEFIDAEDFLRPAGDVRKLCPIRAAVRQCVIIR